MNKTSIEWVKNPDGSQGYTWNPITGCLNGCEYCYARRLANTKLRERYLANYNCAPTGNFEVKYSDNPFYPRFWAERLEQLKVNQKPRGIFTCDMSDLFGIGVPEMWTRVILDYIKNNPWHRFYLLTKQPQNLLNFSPFPDNCWVGVTATGPRMFADALAILKQIEAKVKYVSIEPYLIKIPGRFIEDYGWFLNWIIIGAQTKPYKPPEIEWVYEIIKACDKARIPVFLKDNLQALFPGHDIRQEMP